MTKNDFFELSEKEVKLLNGSTSEDARQAWRAGYNYSRRIVKESLDNDYDFIDKMEEFSNEELPEFK